MPKILTIKGCKDCPYSEYVKQSNKFVCSKHFATFVTPPETPHPDCKLNDLPTNSDIVRFAENQNYILGRTESIKVGADWIIEQITK